MCNPTNKSAAQKMVIFIGTFQNIYRQFDKEGGDCKCERRHRATAGTESWIAFATWPWSVQNRSPTFSV